MWVNLTYPKAGLIAIARRARKAEMQASDCLGRILVLLPFSCRPWASHPTSPPRIVMKIPLVKVR